jgi:hypothetical protein
LHLEQVIFFATPEPLLMSLRDRRGLNQGASVPELGAGSDGRRLQNDEPQAIHTYDGAPFDDFDRDVVPVDDLGHVPHGLNLHETAVTSSSFPKFESYQAALSSL